MDAAGPQSAGAAAHVFVGDLEVPVLGDPDRHHLQRVLRLGDGDLVTAADGRGGWRLCRLIGSGGYLEPVGERATVPRAAPEVSVAFAPTKGDRPEWAVGKLTEIGADEIVVFMAARSVVRWTGDRGVAALARLGRVAREAAMQSRRAWLPEVRLVPSFAEAAGLAGPSPAVMAHFDGEPPSLERTRVLIGPEGGWDAAELDFALARVSLGPHILRTETAATVAGTLLCSLRARLVRPS